MKAFIYKKYGPPDVLQLVEIPEPVPKPDEILVKVMATSVNRTDCANLRAKPAIMRLSMGLFVPKNPILGTEFSGEIAAVGKDISQYEVGQRVFGFADSGIKSYAEYLVLSPKNAFSLIPKDLTYEQAAGCIEGAHYAYNMINKMTLQNGDRVLINGATGGIGTAALQLLNYLGMQITAVCNTKNIHLAKSLGAEHIIDWEQENFTTSPFKYQAILDTSGKSTFGVCKSLLLPGGTYISSELGPWSQNLFYSLTTALVGAIPFTGGKKVKFPYPPDIMRTIRLLKSLIEEDHFSPVIDRVYPFEQIPEAFRYVEKGHKTGNVVVSLA
ncbi:NAD(P)-dependent alcohol dehydrogenase [uncultured Muriicola sp.]|uniref:NAD(P)-dependent alcohol dehydrogenase n=1 Tax=uncultured Muriicola sp. TaxID=1583102 RepID=UPI00261CCF2D|nr:NAD(P)-dependent alcohol dehydrogenase [uncultured Muriicola sp.]